MIFVNMFSEPKLVSSTHTDQMAERTHMLQVLPYKCELFVESGKKIFHTVADFCKYFFRAKINLKYSCGSNGGTHTHASNTSI